MPEKILVHFSDVPKHYAARTHAQMSEVLMDPLSEGPSIHYYMIRGGKNQRNITIWEPGVIGGEYIKTYGHYHRGDLRETYSILLGEGVVLKQKLEGEDPSRIASFSALPVRAGDGVGMERDEGHVIVNTGTTYLVTADDGPVYFDEPDPATLPGYADYKPVKAMRGFAYYIIEHNGKPALKKNPLYTDVRNTDFGGLPIIT